MTLRQANKSIYWAWKSMKQRCQNPKCKAYHNYGARGISVCEEWQKFEPFCSWALENGYQKGLDLDRIDNDSGYSPDYCRWTDRRTNTLNRRCTVNLTVNGITKPCTMWEREAGIPYGVAGAWYYVHGKEYAEFRVGNALKNGYVRNNFSYGHVYFRVRLEDTGEVFDSMAEASRKLNIPISQVRKSVYCGRKTDVGIIKLVEKVVIT